MKSQLKQIKTSTQNTGLAFLSFVSFGAKVCVGLVATNYLNKFFGTYGDVAALFVVLPIIGAWCFVPEKKQQEDVIEVQEVTQIIRRKDVHTEKQEPSIA